VAFGSGYHAAHWLTHAPRDLPVWRLCWQLGFNILLCLATASDLGQSIDLPLRFNRLREVIVYLQTVSAISALFSIFAPTCVFSILNAIATPGGPTENWIAAWTEWNRNFLANFLSFLLVTPAILLAKAFRFSAAGKFSLGRLAEVSLLGLGILLLFPIFSKAHINPSTLPALLYAPLPLMLWAAVRFGPTGASLSLLGLAITSIWIAVRGHGPFTPVSTPEGVLPLQLFLVVLSIPLIFLAAVIEERSRAQEQFANAFRCGPDAMLIKRRRDARIIDVNAEWQKIFGYPREEAIGRTLSELNIYLTADDRVKLITGTAAGKILRDLEISLRTRAGDIRQSSLSAHIVDVGGEECLVIVIRDITDRKNAEAARRNLAHVSRLAVVGELTASIAHEINQPLGAILSNVP
jgi:two-component system, LuxR family, sensor kinase FixL